MGEKPERPNLESMEERDSNYNRIRVPTALRDQIMNDMNEFNDSSESLPIPSDYESDYSDANASREDLNSTTQNATKPPEDPTTPVPGVKKSATGKSKLSKVTQSSDIPTPTAQKGDPLAKAGAMLKNGTGSGEITPTASRKDAGASPSGSGRLSQVPTQEDSEGKKRPGPMRRWTTKIRRTISKSD